VLAPGRNAILGRREYSNGVRGKGEMSEIKRVGADSGRILVLRPGALGDTIVAADALSALRARYPGSIVELVGNAAAAHLLVEAGLIDQATSFDSLDVAALYGSTPKIVDRWHNTQLVVLWLNDADGVARAFREARAKAIVVARPHPPRAFGASPASPTGRGERAGAGQHVSDYLVETLASAGVRPRDSSPALLRRPAVATSGTPTALMHPGSGSPTKNWAPERFAALAALLLDRGWSVHLLRGPADTDAVRAVQRLLGSDQAAIEGPADVPALASVLASVDLYVGNDSGVSHLSARLAVPTVAVFGPTDPAIWAPRGPRSAVVSGDGSWPKIEEVWEAMRSLTAASASAEAASRRSGGAAGRPLEQERRGEENEER
jgi:heptosyltransferase-3